MITKRRGLIAGGVTGLLAALLGARANPVRASQAGQHLEGSWMLDITVLETGARRTTLLTFTPEGGVITTGSDHPTRSPGHGEWVSTGDREFVATWRQLLFDRDGTYSGQLKNRLLMTLDESLEQMTVRGQPETFDLDGNLLTSGRTMTQGTCIRAERPD